MDGKRPLPFNTKAFLKHIGEDYTFTRDDAAAMMLPNFVYDNFESFKEAVLTLIMNGDEEYWADNTVRDCKEEIEALLEPVIAKKIRAIEERAALDIKSAQIEAEHHLEIGLLQIDRRLREKLDELNELANSNEEQRSIMAEFQRLASMPLDTPEQIAEHKHRMAQNIQKAEELFDPETYQKRLRKVMNRAVFEAGKDLRQEMGMPLRRLNKSREEREAAYEAWWERNFF